ncbi:hypothetical protein [Rariglobus hedericola]|uniref:Roadblock/LAMTOR2 domain-containing protein n=1 Tax=Rariglobus hedericola TaxID=2597822 RepID=A0A556QR92_9BACT|nr:hypothetical protein [Rariglobus hedericola]TSJ79156.1 hypothetical protein FPL22_07635 [Rariglobus hedericola]
MVLNKVFDNVLDIPGVDGVCLFGLSGQVFLNRMPSFLSPEVFADALRRITALYETMDENFLPCDDYLLRFSEKWILFRRTDQAVLLVMAAETANFASTRMVTNMALKHLTPAALAEFSPESPVAAAPVAVAARVPTGSTATPFSAPPFPPAAIAPEPVAPAAAAPATEVHKTVRMFRGRAY